MKKIGALIFLILFTIKLIYSQSETRLLRFPDVYENKIVFSYSGDIYLASRQGGTARILTTGAGYDAFPRFSHDGKYIAFTGQFDGNTEVYVIPAEGGTPKRLSYTATLNRDDIGDRMGPNNIVMGWTPDDKEIIYRSRNTSFNDFKGKLYKVPLEGGISEELPFSSAGFCSMSADAKKIAYNRVFREFRTWKNYRGGMTDDIWIYDFSTKKTENICNHPAQDIIPMWFKDEVYFISDRSNRMNLYVSDFLSNTTKQLTEFKEFDIKFPSLSKDAIAFENGGSIYIYDIITKKTEKITIKIENFLENKTITQKNVKDFIGDHSLSHDGERVLITARGDIFSVPSKEGVIRNLSNSSEAHDRQAVWSPDGKFIAYLSDKSGEYEIYLLSNAAKEEELNFTAAKKTYIYRLLWSPDSKKILYNDREFNLWMLDIESKQTKLIVKSPFWEITDFNWSPDSKWITYILPSDKSMETVQLYNIVENKNYQLTDDWYSSYSPRFSRDGKFLLFASDRDFNPTYSSIEWNHAYTQMSNIYLLPLSKETINPLAPTNNEVKIEDKKDAKEIIEDTKQKEIINDTKIDLDDVQNRIFCLGLKPGNYYNIEMVDDNIYYIDKDSNIKSYDVKAKKEQTILESANYNLSSNSKKMMIIKDKSYYVVDLPKAPLTLTKAIDLTGLRTTIRYQSEYKQIFNEAWRQMRDFFAFPNMHGYDWELMQKRYEPLVEHVAHPSDLTYLIGEMISELNIGHAYISTGDKPKISKVYMGLLGAKIHKDNQSGYFKIDKILKGENWNPELRSPLTENEAKVSEGNFIISVNGIDLKNISNIYSTLQGRANLQTEIEINTEASSKGSRKIIITPIASESKLYYFEWVRSNIAKVNAATNGKVGYIHVPDMMQVGLSEFAKYFYPQLNKKALIIDDRGNAGGNVSPMIIERLRRELVYYTYARGQSQGSFNPNQMALGPKVMLIDQYSASDGDLFPYQFKFYDLGKLIGQRTWGGVTGIRGTLPFVDGTDLRKPEFAKYSFDSKEWIIENQGVSPDIEVINDPSVEYQGIDVQLDKAIEIILQEMKNPKYQDDKIPAWPKR